MLIKLPRDTDGGTGRGVRVAALTSIVDAMPTAAEAAGWAMPDGIEGRSLGALIRGGPPVREQLLASLELDGRRAYALIRERDKLIRRLEPDPASLLFDLGADPRETAPLDDPDRQRELERQLDRELARHRAGWRLRVCGGAEPAHVSLRIEGVVGESRAIAFEDDDAVERRGPAVELRVSTGPTVRKKEGRGRLIDVEVRDADELAFDAEAVQITRGADSSPAHLVLREPTPWSTPLEVSRAMARRPVAAASDCEPAEHAVVHLWYVDAPSPSTRAEPDPLLRARLEALGYLESDSESHEAATPNRE